MLLLLLTLLLLTSNINNSSNTLFVSCIIYIIYKIQITLELFNGCTQTKSMPFWCVYTRRSYYVALFYSYQISFCCRIQIVWTTAFTNKPTFEMQYVVFLWSLLLQEIFKRNIATFFKD